MPRSALKCCISIVGSGQILAASALYSFRASQVGQSNPTSHGRMGLRQELENVCGSIETSFSSCECLTGCVKKVNPPTISVYLGTLSSDPGGVFLAHGPPPRVRDTSDGPHGAGFDRRFPDLSQNPHRPRSIVPAHI